MGKYEVTQGQWTSVMGANPAHFSACGWDCPVESVSASDVEAFIGVLNRQEAAAGSPYRYRLPTAEEWLSAPWRGGERLDEIRPVGRERANAWGLHGMNGSVWEWTSSTFPNGRRIILSDGALGRQSRRDINRDRLPKWAGLGGPRESGQGRRLPLGPNGVTGGYARETRNCNSSGSTSGIAGGRSESD